MCKCNRRVRHTGQDESVYKAYAREGKEWVVQGVRGMRKKSEGPGEMVSAFQDERHGFDLSLTDEQLAAVNLVREAKGAAKLERSPGLRFLVFGKNKGGFWGFEQFKEQVEDVLDILETIEPELQAAGKQAASFEHERQVRGEAKGVAGLGHDGGVVGAGGGEDVFRQRQVDHKLQRGGGSDRPQTQG